MERRPPRAADNWRGTMRARSITLWVALVLAAVCSTVAAPLAAAGPAVLDPAPQAKWTVMVYMDGGNDLEPWITREIEREMAATGSSADVESVALEPVAAISLSTVSY